MKRKIILPALLIFISGVCNAQIPQGFNYQAIARNASGIAISETDLKVEITILSDALLKTVVWKEEHLVTTNAYGLFTLVVGGPAAVRTGGTATAFNLIDWTASEMFISVGIKNPPSANSFTPMGESRLWSVPYALAAGDASAPFIISSDDEADDPLFEVRRKDGQPVFTVYDDAVTINVSNNPARKGSPQRGGFAIGGFDETKGETTDLFRVTRDSVRIYIDNNPSFIKGSPQRGGFAIGGFNETKNITRHYLHLFGSSTVDTIRDASQILWYPNKEAFLAGRIFIPSPDSVGQNSFSTGFRTRAVGNFSHAMGYESVALGNYSTAIGRMAVSGENSFALGNNSKALGIDSYAIGSGSSATGNTAFALGVESISSGESSVSIGFKSTANKPYAVAIGYHAFASGLDSYAIGSHAEANGERSFAIGSYGLNEDGTTNTGRSTWAPGYYSIACGMGAQATKVGAMALGVNATAAGDQSVAIGFGAGANSLFAAALGYKAMANGIKSIAIGSYYHFTFNKLEWVWDEGLGRWIIVEIPVEVDKQTAAEGDFSISIGNGAFSANGGLSLGTNNNALGVGSVAIGHSNEAVSDFSFSAGFSNSAQGFKSFALGENLVAISANCFVIGAFNEITGTTNEWIGSDPLFVIGNGNPTPGGRSDAFRVLKDGNIVLSPGIKEGSGLQLYYDPLDRMIKKQVSSARYKSGITPIDEISWIYDLKPVSFFYKNDANHSLQYGLIAEDIEEVNSTLVIKSEGQPEGVNYNGLIAPMIKAIQDQKQMIDRLNEENAALARDNEELKTRLANLENAVLEIMSAPR